MHIHMLTGQPKRAYSLVTFRPSVCELGTSKSIQTHHCAISSLVLRLNLMGPSSLTHLANVGGSLGVRGEPK